MSKNVTIGTKNYTGIDKVQLKETGAETFHDFVDTTDADAIAGEIVDGKTAYVNGTKLTGTLEEGVDTSDATATEGDILASKTAYVDGTKLTGDMVDRGAVDTDISAKGTEVTIQAGYHNGSGATKIATAEQDKIIAGNIKDGITILGVEGTLEATEAGTPVAFATEQVLPAGFVKIAWTETNAWTWVNNMANIIITSEVSSSATIKYIYADCLNISGYGRDPVLTSHPYYVHIIYHDDGDFADWVNNCGDDGSANCGTTNYIVIDTRLLSTNHRTIASLGSYVGNLGLTWVELTVV